MQIVLTMLIADDLLESSLDTFNDEKPQVPQLQLLTDIFLKIPGAGAAGSLLGHSGQ